MPPPAGSTSPWSARARRIYYAATLIEARGCADRPVVVIGGANSAGQAALFLAERGCPVQLVVRAADLGVEMSSYLVDRLHSQPRVTVRVRTEVVALYGEDVLAGVRLRDNRDASTEVVDCVGLFCFIGATPSTAWLGDVLLDDDGFVLTDAQLRPDELPVVWQSLHGAPLPYETSRPGVFAVGDARSSSMKRIASAVGEGAAALHSVHRAIARIGSSTSSEV